MSEAGAGKGSASAERPLRALLLTLDDGSAAAKLSGPGFVLTDVQSFAEAMSVLPVLRPDVIVAALTELQVDDVSGLKLLLRAAGSAPVLIVSRPVAEERAVELIKAGAGGYLFTRDTEYLATAVRELVRGGVPMSAPVSRLVMQRARRSSAKMAAVRPEDGQGRLLLTDRQRQILELLQHGHSYDHIGVALGLSVNTVRSHVRAIYERLGVVTKVEAVMVGMELGILQRTHLSDRPSA